MADAIGLASGRPPRHGPARGEHLAGDALAGLQPVAEPLVGAVVPGGRQRGAVLVEQVDAGDARRRRPARPRAPACRARPAARARRSARARRARARRRARAWLDAPLLGLQPRQAERRLVGERLGEQDLVGRPGLRARCGRAPRRDGRRRPRRAGTSRAVRAARRVARSAPSSSTVRPSSRASVRAVAATYARPCGAGSPAAGAGSTLDAVDLAARRGPRRRTPPAARPGRPAERAASERRRRGACAACARMLAVVVRGVVYSGSAEKALPVRYRPRIGPFLISNGRGTAAVRGIFVQAGAQQAPAFCAQKSSNCWASEPAGGGVSFAAESSGAAVASGDGGPAALVRGRGRGAGVGGAVVGRAGVGARRSPRCRRVLESSAVRVVGRRVAAAGAELGVGRDGQRRAGRRAPRRR